MDCPINNWWKDLRLKQVAETVYKNSNWLIVKKKSKLAVNWYFGLFVELDEDIIIKSRFAVKAH